MTSALINNKLKALARSYLSYQTPFLLPHSSTSWPPILEHLFVCVYVCVTMLVCFSDGSNAAMQYWMAEGEKGHHGKVYKIIWSCSAFLCTVRLCPSSSLHPHQVFGPRYKMVVSVMWSMLTNLPASDDINIIFRMGHP